MNLQKKRRRVILGVSSSFEAAHYIKADTGKCHRLHGHSYKVEVEVSGYPDNDGMVINFKNLKTMLDSILEMYDHKNLNEELSMDNVTAEFLASILWDELEREINTMQNVLEVGKGLRLERVRVWEGYKYYAEVRRSE